MKLKQTLFQWGLLRMVQEGMIPPLGYGFCYENWVERSVYLAPVPLNIIFRWVRHFWLTLVRKPRLTNVYDPNYRAAFNAGNKAARQTQKFLESAENALQEMEELKNQAYWERGQLVALLTRLYPSHIVNATGKDDWPTVIVDSPKGQLSWHIPAEELSYYAGLPIVQKSDWDGHTTEVKYARLWKIGRPQKVKVSAAK